MPLEERSVTARKRFALAALALLLAAVPAWGSYVTNPVTPQYVFEDGKWVWIYIYDFYADGDYWTDGFRMEDYLSLTGFDATKCENIFGEPVMYQRWDLTAADKNYFYLPATGSYPSTNNLANGWGLETYNWKMTNFWHTPSEYTEGYPVISPGYFNCLGVEWYDLTDPGVFDYHEAGLYLTVRIVHTNPPTGTLNWTIGVTGAGQIRGPAPPPPPGVTSDYATNVQPTEATAWGTLVSNSPALVTVYWGTTDEGENGPAWDHSAYLGQLNVGPQSGLLTGLDPDTTYYFRFFAENAGGTKWGNAASFVTPSRFTGWPYKRKITFAYDRGEALSNFPVLVALDPGSFDYSQLGSTTNGADLRFATADHRTELDYEVEVWNTNGESILWVQADTFGSNTAVWMYWGNTNETVLPAYTTDGSTWSDGGYLAVWHLNGTNAAGKFPESLATGWDGVNYGCTPVAAVIGNGQDFNASNRIDITGLYHSGGTDANRCYAFHFWLKSPQSATSRYLLDAFGTLIFAWNVTAAGQVGYFDGTWRGNFGSGLNDDAWHHIVYVLDGAALNGTVYADGHSVGTAAYSPQDIGAVVFLGCDWLQSGTHYDGLMDEVRVSKTVRSSNWVWATYLNQASNDAFITVGPTLEDVDLDGMLDSWETNHFGDLVTAEIGTDNDGDGSDDTDEYVAGTDPTNLFSVFAISDLTGIDSTTNVIRWHSVSNRAYGLMERTNLFEGTWTRSVSNIPATPPVNSYTVSVTTVEAFFKVVLDWFE
jgi:hypothetical protein